MKQPQENYKISVFIYMQPRETAFNLEENRNLCLECLDTAIMDTNQAQHLYIDIQRFYQGHNMNLDQQIPLRMVETQVMRETSEEYVRKMHFSHPWL